MKETISFIAYLMFFVPITLLFGKFGFWEGICGLSIATGMLLILKVK